jgi:DNA-binding NarL/FixJ family response regulator
MMRDDKAGRFPEQVALRDIIERIYTHDGYSDTQWDLLEKLYNGWTSTEIQDALGISDKTYSGRIKALRMRIITHVFNEGCPEIDVDTLTERQQQIYALYRSGLSQRKIAAQLKVSRSAVSVTLRRLRYQAAGQRFEQMLAC